MQRGLSAAWPFADSLFRVRVVAGYSRSESADSRDGRGSVDGAGDQRDDDRQNGDHCRQQEDGEAENQVLTGQSWIHVALTT